MSSDSSSDCEFYYASIKQIAFGIASKNMDEGDGFWRSCYSALGSREFLGS